MQQFARVKLTVIFYLAAWKMLPATDSQAEIKKNRLLVNFKQTVAQPLFKGHFYSGDTFLGPESVPRVIEVPLY